MHDREKLAEVMLRAETTNSHDMVMYLKERDHPSWKKKLLVADAVIEYLEALQASTAV